jgi:hypothetical protein
MEEKITATAIVKPNTIIYTNKERRMEEKIAAAEGKTAAAVKKEKKTTAVKTAAESVAVELSRIYDCV